MSKLLIPNTTQVPNVLLDVVMPQIKNVSLRVLLAVVRKTYGFQKKADKISLSQLQKLTGLSRQGVVDGIAGLGCLLKISSKDGMNEYALDLDVATGELVNLFDQSKTLTSQKYGEKVVNKLDIQNQIRTKPKNPSFSSAIENIIRRLNELSGRAYRTDSNAVLKYLRARLKAGATEADCLAVVEDRWRHWGNDEKMCQHFNPVTLFREENFARYLAEAQAGSSTNGQAKPPVVKDLGDGFVEVNGRRMDRQTFERRYNATA